MPDIKAGDTVKHGPSGEEWIVAAIERSNLSPCGWPETIAKVADCELIESCSDEEHWKQIEKWGRMDRRDWRVWANREILERVDRRECEAIMRT